MPGNRQGGIKAAKTNKERHGDDFFVKIGRKGGLASTPTGGFGSDKVGKDGLTGRERSKVAGSKGGKKSSRASVKHGEGKDHAKYLAKKAKRKGLIERIFGGK